MADQILINIDAKGKASIEIKKVEKSLTDLEKQAKKTDKVFKSTEKGVTDFGKAAKKSAKEAKKASTTFADVFKGNVAANAFSKALSIAGAAARKLFTILGTESVNAARANEDAVAALNQALARNGEFSEAASQGMQDWAASLQQSTTFGSDQILQLSALAQSFGFTAEASKTATEAAIELSVAAGISVDEAVRRVGRTISGSVADVSKFALSINDLTKAELEAGKAADELKKGLAGTAAAVTQTFSGAVKQAKNTFSDFQTAIGKVITESPAITAAIKAFNKFFFEMQRIMKDNRREFDGFLNGLISGVAKVLPNTIHAFNALLDVFSDLGIVYTTLKIELQRPLFPSDEQAKKFEEFEERTVAAMQKSQGASKKRREALFKLGLIVDKLSQQVIASTQLTDKQTKAFINNTNASKEAADALARQKKLQDELGTEGAAVADAATGGSSKIAQIKTEQEALKESRELELVTEQEFFEKRQALIIEDFEAKQLALQAAKQQEKITEDEFSAAQIATAQKRTKAILKNASAQAKAEESIRKKNVQAVSDSLGNLASLQTSHSKTAAKIGRAAAIAQAIVNATTGISNALAGPPTGPPFPLNIVMAASIGASQFANIQKIKSAPGPKLAKGIDEVPPGFENDSFRARLSSGERVIPAKSNQDLKSFLAEQDGNKGLLELIAGKLDEVANVTVNVGEDTITTAVRRSLESGNSIEVPA